MEQEEVNKIDLPVPKRRASGGRAGGDRDGGADNQGLHMTVQVVAADSVQAEEVPTIPLGPLQKISELQPEISVQSIASTKSVRLPRPLVVQPAEYRRSFSEWLQIWWDGIRPAYLPLSLMPLLLGSALAWIQTIPLQPPFGHFHVLHFIGSITALILLQSGAHVVNDYYDYVRGIDTSNTLGPGGLIQQGLMKPSHVLGIGMTLLALGSIVGLIVAFAGGPLVYIFGLVGLLCAYFYSGTSQSLASHALSEPVCFLIFGPLITLGAFLVQAGYLDQSILLYSVAPGLLAAAVIHVNNMRDMEGDSEAGKRTLASILGIHWSRAWFLVLLAGAYIVILALGIPHNTPHLILVTFWTLPLLLAVCTGVLRTDTAPALNLVVRGLLRLETYFVCLMVVALIASVYIGMFIKLPLHFLPGK